MLPKPPSPRVLAPHVQAALAPAVQAKPQDRTAPVRLPAQHVRSAVGAVQRQVPVPPAGIRQPPHVHTKLGAQIVRTAPAPAQVKLPPSPAQSPPLPPQIQATLRSADSKVIANPSSRRLSDPVLQTARSPAHRTVQPYMRDLPSVEPLIHTISALRKSCAELRAKTTRWQKSGVAGGARAAVSTANTVISSALLEWLTLGGFERAEFRPHISGFPFTDQLDKSNKAFLKHYSVKEEEDYTSIGDDRKCAERKILVDAEKFLKKHAGTLHRPCLYIFSEKAPCSFCEQAIEGLKAKYKTLQVVVFSNTDSLAGEAKSTWDYFELVGHKAIEDPPLYGLNLGSIKEGAKPVKKKLSVTLPATATWGGAHS